MMIFNPMMMNIRIMLSVCVYVWVISLSLSLSLPMSLYVAECFLFAVTIGEDGVLDSDETVVGMYICVGYLSFSLSPL